MVFSSLLFVFFFLPIVTVIYFLAKEEYRNYILLCASLLFYAYGEPRFIFVMLASIIINYGLALWIRRAKDNGRSGKKLLIFALSLNLGILFFFKYLDFSINLCNAVFHANIPLQNITLPIGISFFTFQAMSYVIDVYRGGVPVQKNPLYLALYISFFPQLIAGPIVRYSTIEQQIRKRECTAGGLGEGAKRFLLGFCKKVLLANNLSVAAAAVFQMTESNTQLNPLLLWIGSICYSLQIFYDFSGYSDMAIGLGRIFGFEFEENFNYPYISKSITEFWKRWHISLGQWFRDYVYIPLGGSRVSVKKHLWNLFVVWILTGIWHGARLSFIAWGCGYYILLVFEKYMIKPEIRRNKIICIIWQVVTLLCVNFGWVIFNANGIKAGIRYCLGMVGYYNVQISIDPLVVRYLREYGAFLAAGIVCSTPLMKKIGCAADKHKLSACIHSIVIPGCYGICFLWAVSYLVLGAHNPFIYFNF